MNRFIFAIIVWVFSLSVCSSVPATKCFIQPVTTGAISTTTGEIPTTTGAIPTTIGEIPTPTGAIPTNESLISEIEESEDKSTMSINAPFTEKSLENVAELELKEEKKAGKDWLYHWQPCFDWTNKKFTFCITVDGLNVKRKLLQHLFHTLVQRHGSILKGPTIIKKQQRAKKYQ